MRIEFGILIIIVIVLCSLCTFQFGSVVYIKISQIYKDRQRAKDTKNIKPILNRLLSAGTVDFFRDHKQEISKLEGCMEKKSSLQTLEDILLDLLEEAEGEKKLRLLTISYHFDFPEKCLSLIRSRISGNVAIGCRKAGLFNYENAIPEILKTLEILSSEVQLQALMALARIGNTAAMIEAFDKIHRLIFFNERAANEILNVFSGNRQELYKHMLHHQSNYLVCLFLKSINSEVAGSLINDIVSISENAGKETRLAGIIAISKSGKTGKIPMLIKALNDAEWEIRAMAAKTLGILTGPRAVKPLIKAAGDREWWVRQNAVTSILAYPNCEDILCSIARTGDKYAYDSVLYCLGKANRPQLLTAVKDVWK